MGGRLIVFEGVEGCGKSTQLQRSRQWLETLYPLVVVTCEPGGTTLGVELRRLLLTKSETKPVKSLTELLLYAADRAQHIEEFIKPQLGLGAIILCDRYTDSTIAYQGYGRGLSLSLINQLNFIATGGLESDLTLWLDIDVEESLARTRGRGVTDRIEQETIEFHRRVQQGYTQLAAAHPHRVVRIDASLSQTAVQAQIQAVLSQSLKNEFF